MTWPARLWRSSSAFVAGLLVYPALLDLAARDWPHAAGCVMVVVAFVSTSLAPERRP